MDAAKTTPSRDDVIRDVARRFYTDRILNNAHRGDVVEVMVLSALGSDWKMVGLGWHPWDLQRGSGTNRVRIQVRQVAALQLWGQTKKLVVTFGWKDQSPSYFKRDHPNEEIEAEGWFCDLFVVGLHLMTDRESADQVDPNQWQFLVIPKCDLNPRQASISLDVAKKKWQAVNWHGLAEAVERAIAKSCPTLDAGPDACANSDSASR